MTETLEEQIKRLRAEVSALMTEKVIRDAEESKRRRLADIKKRKKEAIEYDRWTAQQTVKSS